MRDAIDRAVHAGEWERLVVLLEEADAPDIRYAARRLTEWTDDPTPIIDRMLRLAEREAPAGRHVACHLAKAAYRDERERTLGCLRRLAADDDPAVRSAAATSCGRLFRSDFSYVLERLRAWATDEHPEVRRSVVLSVIRASRHDRPEWGEPLLRLIEPLLVDRDPAVRRSLGPAALATTLLEDYPMLAFEYIVRWSTSQDAQTLWNVAMAFSGPAAAPIVKKALIVLRKLSLDERRYVWRAVASAMWKLGRRRPDIVRPELARWLEDERRLDVARAALEHI